MFKFVLVQNIGRDGTLPIKLRITVNRKSKYINTGFRVKPYEWNEVKSQVNSKHPDYESINYKLETLLKEQTQLSEKLDTIELLPKIQLKTKSTNKEISIEKIIEMRLSRELKLSKVSTEKKLKTALGHLKKSGHAKLGISKFNLTAIKELDIFLATECGISAYSRKCYHGVIRATLNEYSNEYDVAYDRWNDPYRRFKGEKIGEVKKVSLTGDDIHKITEYLVFHPTKSGRKFDTACMFLFSFYTCGLRFGDVFNLSWSNLEKDGNIRVTAEKNYKKLVAKLNPKQVNILKYYTPLRSLYQKDFSNRTEVEEELVRIFPRISRLIEYEIKYINLRRIATPQSYALINSLFENEGIELELMLEDKEIALQLRETYEIRDELLTEFLIAYAQHYGSKPIFNFKDDRNYNLRDLTLKKESANALVNKELKNVLKDLKIREVSFHVARHTFANLARLSADKDSSNPIKWDIYRISRALGHSSIKVTEIYLKGFESTELTGAMDSLIGVMNQYFDV